MENPGRGDEIVCDGDLLVLRVEYALVGFRPCAIQAFNSLLSFQFRVDAAGMEVIAGIFDHHGRSKDFLIAPSNFQQTVPGIRLQEKPMPSLHRGIGPCLCPLWVIRVSSTMLATPLRCPLCSESGHRSHVEAVRKNPSK